MKTLLSFLVLLLFVACSPDDSVGNLNRITPPTAEYFVTVSGVAMTNACDLSTPYRVDIAYTADGENAGVVTLSGTSNEIVEREEAITANVIGIRISMNEFSESNPFSGRGAGFRSILVEIRDVNGELIHEMEMDDLYICDTAIYETYMSYDVQEDAFTRGSSEFTF